jgi:hypothetical protein
MGNTKSSSSSSKPLAIAAVAKQLKVQRHQIIALRDALDSFSDSLGMVSHEDYLQALELVDLSGKKQLDEIFKLLYIMWEDDGSHKIPYKKFSLGVAPLACPYDELPSLIRFILYVYGPKDQKIIDASDLSDLLKSECAESFFTRRRMYSSYIFFSFFCVSVVSESVSHFGDKPMKSRDIQKVVQSIFDNPKEGRLSHDDCTSKLSKQPLIKKFVANDPKRVKFKENLVVVTEYHQYECPSKHHYSTTYNKVDISDGDDYYYELITSPINAVGSLLKANFQDFGWNTEDIGYNFINPCDPTSVLPPSSSSTSSYYTQNILNNMAQVHTNSLEERIDSFKKSKSTSLISDEEEDDAVASLRSEEKEETRDEPPFKAPSLVRVHVMAGASIKKTSMTTVEYISVNSNGSSSGKLRKNRAPSSAGGNTVSR